MSNISKRYVQICSNHDLSLTATLHETSWSNHGALSVLSVNSSRWQRLDMASRPCPAAGWRILCITLLQEHVEKLGRELHTHVAKVSEMQAGPRSLRIFLERIAAQRRWCLQLLGTWNHIRSLDGCWECWNMLKYTFQLSQLSAVHFVWGAQSAWCVQLHQKNWTVLHSSAKGHFWVDAFLYLL